VCVCLHVADSVLLLHTRNESHVFSAARFEVLSAALTKRQVFCDVTPDLTARQSDSAVTAM
jgi:hypothetical protein